MTPGIRFARRRPASPHEHVEMVALARWLDMRRLVWCHPPNEAKRSFAVAARLRAEGLKTGVPDVLIFTPPTAQPGRGVALELKRKVGGVVSDDQRRWLEDLRRCGWVTLVARGADEAIKLLLGCGY